MNTAGIIHRTHDHYAYVCTNDELCLTIQTAQNDIDSIVLIHGDPYDWEEGKWIRKGKGMQKVGTDGIYDYWEIRIAPPFRRLRYGFQLDDGHEQVFLGEAGLSKEPSEDIAHYFCVPFVHTSEKFNAPGWVKDTVWYQIFPERFANGNQNNDPAGVLAWASAEPTPENFFGGDLEGVIDHIDHLAGLGITGIYFTPVFKAHSNHKYDTIDYMELDPHFGTKETLKQLVDRCQEKGIKVMLDAVFNHSGYYFPPFQDVLKKGKDSKYKDWFHVREFPLTTEPVPNYDTFAFTPMMPKLNTQNPEVKKYLLDVACYWIEECDIDGWRLDVANEVDHQFWREFRLKVKEMKPDLYILGEIWHDSMNWLRGDQFDAVMNYPFTRNALDLLAHESITAKQFVENMTKVLFMYPDTVNAYAFNLIGSHDTPRILHECEGNQEKAKQLFTLLLTFIGTPCIYYGDEIGMDGGTDPGCRKCMEWEEAEQNLDMYNHVHKLIQLRSNEELLRNAGRLAFLPAQEQAFAFSKTGDDGKQVLVIFNTGDSEATFLLPETCFGKDAQDLWTNEKHTANSVILPPRGAAILKYET